MASFCAACGNGMAAGERFCRVCGREASAETATPGHATPLPGVAAKTSGRAIASLVLGLLFFIPFAFVGAIVFGHLALSEIRRSAGRIKGHGTAVAGLILGYGWIAIIPIVLIVAAIAIPNLLRARMAANEASAVAVVRELITAEVTYTGAHPDSGYTCSMPALAQDHLISGSLANGMKSGYTFQLKNCSPALAAGPNIKFQVMARPLTPNQTGIRSFCSDESNVIKADSSSSVEECMENGSTL